MCRVNTDMLELKVELHDASGEDFRGNCGYMKDVYIPHVKNWAGHKAIWYIPAPRHLEFNTAGRIN